MLVFSAIIPPSPLLLPEIGKEHAPQLTATTAAIASLKSSLEASHAEIIVLISQYGQRSERYGIGMCTRYTGSLLSFGDRTEYSSSGSPALAQYLLTHVPHGYIAAVLQPSLDHGSIVALRALCGAAEATVVPIYQSDTTYELHVRMGGILADAMIESKVRIACIATGDLSHHISDASPEGYKAEGVLFDQAVIAALQKNSIKQLLDIAHKYNEEAKISGLRAILLLTSIFDAHRAQCTILAHEAPFGIGYLTAEFVI